MIHGAKSLTISHMRVLTWQDNPQLAELRPVDDLSAVRTEYYPSDKDTENLGACFLRLRSQDVVAAPYEGDTYC